MSYATGISRASVLYTLQWTPEMNYMRLATAWIMVLVLAVIILITVIRFGNKMVVSLKKARFRFYISWLVFLILQVVAMLWGNLPIYQYDMETFDKMITGYRLISIILSWSRIIAFTTALVCSVQFFKAKRDAE